MLFTANSNSKQIDLKSMVTLLRILPLARFSSFRRPSGCGHCFRFVLLVLILFLALSTIIQVCAYFSYSCSDHVDCKGVEEDRTRTLLIFTGRWKFLRVGLPYVYRDVTKNGGILDRVVFIMSQYDDETYTKLKSFITTANGLLEEEVFKMRDLPGFLPGQSPIRWSGNVNLCYYEIIKDLRENPKNQYLKADDDIVYYHPDAIRKMFLSKNSSQCFMHFGNIGGANWRCSITHQRMGLFNNTEINSKLTFEYSPNAICGWKSAECAEVTLRAFLYYYKKSQLDKYIFKGLELLKDRKRFSINFFLFDNNLIRDKELKQVLPITRDDEDWWTVKYSGISSIKQPNCIVGESLMVHFSYSTTVKQMLERGYLKEFEKIAVLEVDQKMPRILWSALDY